MLTPPSISNPFLPLLPCLLNSPTMDLPRILNKEIQTPTSKTASSGSIIVRKRKQANHDDLGYKPPRRSSSPRFPPGLRVTDPKMPLRRRVTSHLRRQASSPLSLTSHFGPQRHSHSHHTGISSKRPMMAAQFAQFIPSSRLSDNNYSDASSTASLGPRQRIRRSALVTRLRRQLEQRHVSTGGSLDKRSIMDWILDSMSPLADCYSDDELLEIAERSQLFDIKRYTFQIHDLDSLAQYWYDQSRLWSCIQPSGGNSPRNVSHPDSFERSTAEWEL